MYTRKVNVRVIIIRDEDVNEPYTHDGVICRPGVLYVRAAVGYEILIPVRFFPYARTVAWWRVGTIVEPIHGKRSKRSVGIFQSRILKRRRDGWNYYVAGDILLFVVVRSLLSEDGGANNVR